MSNLEENMLVIGLDEGGHFESHYPGNKQCTFIAGPVFRCKSEEDINQELWRLEEFFKGVCSKQHANYPSDLHFNRDSNRNIINKTTAQQVKKQLAQELPNFLKTCPHGTYGLYAMVSDQAGMSKDNTVWTGNLTNDDIASNRYEHMAYRVLENLLFYNHKIGKESNLRQYLATRVMGVGDSDELRGDAKKLGYDKRKKSDGTFDSNTVIVTDATSYRAMLSSAAERAGRTDIQCDLNIWSINYNIPQRQQGFLYLADTICSIFQDIIGRISDVGDALQALSEYCKQTVGSQMTMLWAYDPIDLELRSALESEKHMDYFSALLTVQSATKNAGTLGQIYNDLWFSAIQKRISLIDNSLQLQIALEKLDDYIHSNQSNTQYALSIAETLKKAVEKVQSPIGQGNLYFRMAVIEMILHNHQGNHEAAKECYQQCIAYAHCTTIEEFLGIQNMYSVALLDSLHTKEALAIAKEAVNYQEMLNDIRKEVYHNHAEIFASYGRALSQLGQCYAFSGDYENAISSFQKALQHFTESSRDTARTTSYLLHAAVENGNPSLFEEYSQTGFDCKNILSFWKEQHKIPENWSKYQLYVFVKAMYLLYRDQLRKKDITAMTNSLKKKYMDTKDGHPWELIMKYCALLTAYAGGNTETINWFDHEIDASVSNIQDGILPQIVREAHEQVSEAKAGRFELLPHHLLYMYR